MPFTKEQTAEMARNDLASRLNIDAAAITVTDIVEKEFSDMSLGASASGELAAQMMSSGWQVLLEAAGRSYEYRADKYQLRLHNFEGANYVIKG